MRIDLKMSAQSRHFHIIVNAKGEIFFLEFLYVPSAMIAASALLILAFKSASSLRKPIAAPTPSVLHQPHCHQQN